MNERDKFSNFVGSLDAEVRKSLIIQLDSVLQFMKLCRLIDLEAHSPTKPIDRNKNHPTRF